MELPIKFLKLPSVLELTTTGKSSHHKQIKDGLMVPPVRLGENSRAYPLHEINAINAARIAGKSDTEIRQLVSKMVADRLLIC